MTAPAPILMLSQPSRRVHIVQSTSPRRVEVRPTQNLVRPKPRNTRVQVLNDLAGIVQSLNSRLIETIADGGRQSQVAPATTGDTSNYILRTFGAPILTLYDGLGVWFTPHLSNAAPPITLRVDSTGTQALKLASRDGITPLPANTLRMGTPTIAFWDSQENAWIVGTAMAELTQEQLDVLDTTLAQANDASSLAQLAQQSAEAATNAAQGYRDEAQAIVANVDFDIEQAIVAWAADATSAFGQLQSDLSTNYYTITSTDAAISSATTALQSTLEGQIAAGDSAVQGAVDALNATLTTDYYTITSADAAISQALAAWAADATSPFGVLSANLSTNYYTTTQADQAIAGAVTTLETSLSNDIATLTATLQNDYYTTTTTDSAISTAIQTFDAGAAGVTSIQSAVSDITGYAEATASFQVGVNGEVSLLNLVAFNEPGGTTYTLAKISADDIILDGTVTTSKLNVTELSSIIANLGTVTAGKMQSADGKFLIDLDAKKISITV